MFDVIVQTNPITVVGESSIPLATAVQCTVCHDRRYVENFGEWKRCPICCDHEPEEDLDADATCQAIHWQATACDIEEACDVLLRDMQERARVGDVEAYRKLTDDRERLMDAMQILLEMAGCD